MAVILGNPAQLPPSGANSLWIYACQCDDLVSWILCKYFSNVIKWTEKKLDNAHLDAVVINQILDEVRDSENAEEDWSTLCEKFNLVGS